MTKERKKTEKIEGVVEESKEMTSHREESIVVFKDMQAFETF